MKILVARASAYSLVVCIHSSTTTLLAPAYKYICYFVQMSTSGVDYILIMKVNVILKYFLQEKVEKRKIPSTILLFFSFLLLSLFKALLVGDVGRKCFQNGN